MARSSDLFTHQSGPNVNAKTLASDQNEIITKGKLNQLVNCGENLQLDLGILHFIPAKLTNQRAV